MVSSAHQVEIQINKDIQHDPHYKMALDIVAMASSDIDEFVYCNDTKVENYKTLEYNAWAAFRWVNGMFPDSEGAISFRFICDSFSWNHEKARSKLMGKWLGRPRLELLEHLAETKMLNDPVPERPRKGDCPGQMFLFDIR